MKHKLLLFFLFTSTVLFATPSVSLVNSAMYFDANGDGLINAGDTIIYTFTVTNTGDVSLTNLTVTDLLLNPSLISNVPSGLNPSDVASFSVNYTITQSDINTGSITNTATVTATDGNITVSDISDSDNPLLTGANDPTVTQLQMISHPAIGLIMEGQYWDPNMVQYSFRIKNKGDETLTDIYVSILPANNPSFQYFYPELSIYNQQTGGNPLVHITSLAPGQEDYYTFAANNFQPCFSQNQAMVIGTTSSGIKIIDLSDPYDYYSNYVTNAMFNPIFQFNCDGVYQDANSNNIVDIGDVVNYTYQLNYTSAFNMPFTLIDSNTILSNPNGTSNSGWTTTGVHHITQNDIDLGYVTNSPTIEFPQSQCPVNPYNIYFNDPTPCTNCPTPINCLSQFSNNCIITRISPLLSNLISGTVKFNTNYDNCLTGIGYPNKLVTTTTGTDTYGSFTNSNGYYSLYIPNSGIFDTNAQANIGNGISSNPTNVTQVSSGENMNYTTNFCMSSATNVNDLSVVLMPTDHARPGFTSSYRLHYVNRGTTSLSGNIQLNFDSGKMSFYSAYPYTNSSTANTLTWNFNNLLPYQYQNIDVFFNILAPPTVNQGDNLIFTVVGTPSVADANTVDNTFVLNQAVVNSFDPNDKTVLEGATISAAQATQPLHYVTRFQNTGTYPANTVVIKETLDADLDWNTFEPTGSSNYNNYRIQIKNGNQVTITFDAINLPNSSANEAGSHGWFSYQIKPKSTFAIGNIASSSSNIYFDYNLPITTNVVNTQISALSSTEFDKNSFKIYPNPVNNYFIIQSNINEASTYEIVGVNGNIISNGNVENRKPIDISELASGFYFVNIKTQNAKQTYKIIKN